MIHKNMLYYETQEELVVDYPEGEVNEPVPGVAYASDEKTVYFNHKMTRYTVTVHHQDEEGNELAEDTVVESQEVLNGQEVIVKVFPVEIPDYEPSSEGEKIPVSENTEYTFFYTAVDSGDEPEPEPIDNEDAH